MKTVIIRSNPVAPDPRVERAANALGRRGLDVEVLAWDRTGNHSRLDDRENYHIRRIRMRAPYGNPTLIFLLPFWNLLELAYLLRSKFDLIHACDLDTLIPAVVVSKIRRGRLIYECFDFYSDCLPRRVPGLLRRLFAGLEIALAHEADLVILVDAVRARQFRDELTNTVVISNSPSDVASPIACDSVSEEGRAANRSIVVFYAGVLDRSRGFDQIIRATEREVGVSVVIAGFGKDEQGLTTLFSSARNVEFLGKISHEDVVRRSMQSDVLIALYDPSIPNHRYACPNKLFEAMMCSKPIIVSDSTLMADIVRRENCGVVVPYGDVRRLRDSILQLREDRDLRLTLGRNGREAYLKKYSWNVMESRLIEAYRSCESK